VDEFFQWTMMRTMGNPSNLNIAELSEVTTYA
jgi:hypothetical protein